MMYASQASEFIFIGILYFLQIGTAQMVPTSPVNKLESFTRLGYSKSWDGNQFVQTNYYASQSAASWSSAVTNCQTIFGSNGSLLAIESKEEHTFLSNFLSCKGFDVGTFWTSGMYDMVNQTWTWAANPKANFNEFTAWGEGEPKSHNSRQNIAVKYFESSNYWIANDDSALHQIICEVQGENLIRGKGISSSVCSADADKSSGHVNAQFATKFLLLLILLQLLTFRIVVGGWIQIAN